MVAKKGSSKTSGKRGRSAITGGFVKQSTVKSNPKTTVNESTKKSGGKPKKGK
jgi:hypothetical protein